MRLTDFLHPDFVLLRLEATDAEAVIAEVSRAAEEAGVGPGSVVQDKLLERERLHPTVMGQGLAIPHATVPGLGAPVIGVALTGGRPVAFGSADQDPVRLFFILLSPPGHEREHVKLLARICRLVRHAGFLESLENAEDAQGALSIIASVDAQHV